MPEGVSWRWHDALAADDIEQLTDMLGRVLAQDTTVGFAGPLPRDEARRVIEELDRELRNGYALLLTPVEDDRIVGQVVLAPVRSPNNRHIAWMTRGMLEPTRRGRRITWLAFEQVCATCRQRGIDILCLDVRQGTTSEQIWRKMGFEPFGLLPDYSRVGGQSYAGVYLYQRVDALAARVAAALTH